MRPGKVISCSLISSGLCHRWFRLSWNRGVMWEGTDRSLNHSNVAAEKGWSCSSGKKKRLSRNEKMVKV